MSKPSLDPAQTKAMLLQVADKIIASEPELSEADRRLGDGDHGIGMARGMEAAKTKLAETADDSPVGEIFTAMGMAMMSSMGGASGVVFGSMFRVGKKALRFARSLHRFRPRGGPPPSRRCRDETRRRQAR